MLSISLNKKVIFFGFIFTFFSSFGQSFFLGLFNPSIRSELGISHGEFGSVYAIATIFSSLLLVWFGKKIDEIKIFQYSLIVVVLLSVASFNFSLINNFIYLFFAIFLMRFSGQGLMSHTASTTISRYFNKRRGKALSAIWFGLSTAEFTLPTLMIFLLTIFSWRVIWQSISLLIILALPLIIYFTIKNITFETREQLSNDEIKSSIKIKDWTRGEVLRDFKFYILSLNMLAMPWIATGVFIYQSFIAESKSWDIYLIPKSFMVYSITSILTLVYSGFLVDRFTSRKLIPFMNIPMLIGLSLLYIMSNEYVSFLFFGLLGVSNGLANVLGSSTWAEVYGVRYIGSIKALTTAFMVLSTAFGTAIFGFLIDINFTIEQISMTCIIYTTISLALLIMVKRSIEPINITKST